MKKANAPAPADVQVLLPAAMMNGKAVVDSREVARMLGRPHKNLLADIHRYISAMERRKADGLNFQPVARDFQLVDFFVPSTYTNDHNQTFPCYLLTQKGCEMVANKLTGEKGILFTAAYVNAFHALQEQAQAGAMVPTVRAAPAALPAAPARHCRDGSRDPPQQQPPEAGPDVAGHGGNGGQGQESPLPPVRRERAAGQSVTN